MSFSAKRRLILGASILSLTGAGMLGWTHWRHKTSGKSANRSTKGYSTLSAVVDTLIPADEYLGALDLRVDQSMLDKMRDSPPLKTRYVRLMQSVEQVSLHTQRTAFSDLNLANRESLLLNMLEHNAPRQAKSDLLKFRRAVFKLFYQNPAGQDSLNYLAPARYTAYRSHQFSGVNSSNN